MAERNRERKKKEQESAEAISGLKIIRSKQSGPYIARKLLY